MPNDASEAKERSRANNHSYWSAVGAAGAALAGNDAELFLVVDVKVSGSRLLGDRCWRATL